jgi:iron complex outermembrane receptor protein
MKLQPKLLSLAIAGLFASGTAFAQTPPAAEKKADSKTTELGTVSVTGEGDKLGTGTIIQEEGTKARSTATKASIEKQRSTSNPFQLIQLLPGVNTSSQDGTGLFGGAIRVRGFNSDQMGFTVDGAPVNDSGSFSIFPQEYVDAENLEEVFVTQGSADNEAPHVGATGGNIGITSSNPLDKQRVRLQSTFGQLHLSKQYLRYDSGLIGDFKAYLSYSKARVDKFKGFGSANREHIDFKAMYNLGKGSSLQATVLYNNAINNNIRNASLAEIATRGRTFDYAGVFTPPEPTPVTGTAQTPPSRPDGYFQIPINPFKNAVITGKGWFALTPALRLDIEPYFWWGFGNGNGTAPTITSIREGTVSGPKVIGRINSDADLLDTVSVFRSSVTQTQRPGATVKFNWQFGNQRIVAGYWYERARHRQTQPATALSPNGDVPNYFLNDETQLIRYTDGTLYQGRNQNTISTADSFFVTDTISLLNDKLVVIPGIKTPRIKRDFTNYANSGFNQQADYQVSRSYTSTNPSLGLRYSVSDASQLFANVSKGSKTPGNFIFASAYRAATNSIVINDTVKQETSVNTDMGYRYLSDSFTASGTLFSTQFKNRIGTSYDPLTATSTDTNVGDASIRGMELEAGTKPFMGFSVYASLTYTKSKINADQQILPATALLTNLLPTSGKEFPDTPKWLSGLTLQYANGPFLAGVSTKYTGARYSSLVNDEKVGGYTLTDLNMAYKLPQFSSIKGITLRFNVSNLFDNKSLLLNSGSGTQFTQNTKPLPGVVAGNGSTVFYYIGAPRFASASITMDF